MVYFFTRNLLRRNICLKVIYAKDIIKVINSYFVFDIFYDNIAAIVYIYTRKLLVSGS